MSQWVQRIGIGLVAGTLTLGALTPSYAAMAREPAPWGSTAAPDRVLRPGCHDYGYHYTISPPDPEWALEVFLIDPRGRALGSDTFVSGADQTKGRDHFRICKPTTKPGRFRIRAKVTSQDGYDQTEGRLATSSFRLRRAR